MQRAAPTVRPLTPALAWFVISVPLLIFLLFAVAARSGHPFSWENTFLTTLHDATSPALDPAASWCSRIFHPQFLIIAAALIAIGFALRRQWRWTILTLAAVPGALLLNTLAKTLIDRPRPALWPSLTGETSSGFPSAHAMISFAFAALLVLILYPTRWRIPALVTATLWLLLVALARLILGAHYPTDILAGWTLTLAWIASLWRLIAPRHPQ